MKTPFIQKVRDFLCRVLGHKVNEDLAWRHNGDYHNTCNRCFRIVSFIKGKWK